MIKGNPVSAYLIHSFLYYICNMSIISDAEYDEICVDLLSRFDEIEHPHKHLLDKNALKAGSGYHLSIFDYPPICQNIGMALREDPKYLDKLHAKWNGKPAPTMGTVESPSTATPPVSTIPKKQMSLLDL